MSEELKIKVEQLQTPTTVKLFVHEGEAKVLSVFKDGRRACMAIMAEHLTEPEFEKFINLLCDEFWLQNQQSRSDDTPPFERN